MNLTDIMLFGEAINGDGGSSGGGLPKVVLSTVVNMQEQESSAPLSEEESAAVELAAENGVFLVEMKATSLQEFSPEAILTFDVIMQKVTLSEGGVSISYFVADCFVDSITFYLALLFYEGAWIISVYRHINT